MDDEETATGWDEIREQFQNRVERLGPTETDSETQRSEAAGPTTTDATSAADTTDHAEQTEVDSAPEATATSPPEVASPSTPTDTTPSAQTATDGQPPNHADSRPTDEPSAIPAPPQIELPTRKSDYNDVEAFNPDRSGDKLTQVYRATHPDIDRPVVLKGPFGRGTISREDRQAILDEAQTWQRFAGADHVVTLLNSGNLKEPWLVMEYMDGGALTDRIGDLPIEQALWTGICITHGVKSAHRRAVHHLDIKPSNILFRSVEGAWDIPKVADWGTSQTVTDSHSSLPFTPKYAAPEQHLNEFPSLRDRHDINWGTFGGDATETDQYQVGLVLYELLTGEFPFDTSKDSINDVKFKQKPRPPSELVDSLPPTIDDPLMKALRTEPWRRHSDLVILLEELAQVYDVIVDREVSLDRIKYDGWTTVGQ